MFKTIFIIRRTNCYTISKIFITSLPAIDITNLIPTLGNSNITIYTMHIIQRNIKLLLFNIISYINIVTKVIGIESISLTTGSNLL